MDDLGPGDVVEAMVELHVSPDVTGQGAGYDIDKGSRAIVAQVGPTRIGVCIVCGDATGPALLLLDYPLRTGVAWCAVCEWRKVGGSKADHLKWFADHVRPKPEPALAKPRLGGLRRLIRRDA